MLKKTSVLLNEILILFSSIGLFRHASFGIETFHIVSMYSNLALQNHRQLFFYTK